MATIPVPFGTANARPMRVIGSTLSFIRTKPTAATVAGGDGLVFGAMNDAAVGVYELSWQEAASATALPLSTKAYAIFEVFETTAGVWLAKLRTSEDIEGGTAIDDADDVTTQTDTTSSNIVVDGDSGTNARLDFGVATSTGVTNTSGLAGLTVGDLYLWNGLNTNFTVFALRRVS